MTGEGLPVGTVLVAEDDGDIREMLAIALSHYGFEVLLARHGGEALAVLRSAVRTPQLVLLDLNMRTMDGKQFLVEKQADARLMHIPVVVMTAAGARDQLATEVSVAGWLSKPVRLAKLLATVVTYCGEVGGANPRAG